MSESKPLIKGKGSRARKELFGASAGYTRCVALRCVAAGAWTSCRLRGAGLRRAPPAAPPCAGPALTPCAVVCADVHSADSPLGVSPSVTPALWGDRNIYEDDDEQDDPLLTDGQCAAPRPCC